jgi:hypothetical protein
MEFIEITVSKKKIKLIILALYDVTKNIEKNEKKYGKEFYNHPSIVGMDDEFKEYIIKLNNIIKCFCAKNLITNRYRNAQVKITTLIGINKIYDNYSETLMN